MRNIFFPILLLLIVSGCSRERIYDPPPQNLLDLYSKQTNRTDPASMDFMYNELPHSYDSLCDLIKSLLLHPFDAAEYGIDFEDVYKDGSLQTVESILYELYGDKEKNLLAHRPAKERVVVACYHHAMMLTSMLRYQGIPVRMRAGYSRHFEKEHGIRFGHVICEMWDETEQRWIYIDPDRNIVDLDKKDFDLASEAWFNLRNKKLKPEKYVSSLSEGLRGVISLMALDASLVTGEEKMYWDLSVIGYEDISRFGHMSYGRLQLLDNLAKYLDNPESNFEELKTLYNNTEELRPTGISLELYHEIIRDN